VDPIAAPSRRRLGAWDILASFNGKKADFESVN
jgi:hypothetical protein